MKDIKIKGTKTEQVSVEISLDTLKEEAIKQLRTIHNLHGNWLSSDGKNLMREEGDYHSDWDVVDRPATKKDKEVLKLIEHLEKYLK